MGAMSKMEEVVYIIPFTTGERRDVLMAHANPLIITTMISNFRIHWMLINMGSLVNVLFYEAFQQMNIPKD